ncbi:probable sulfate transporter 3.4 isoform X2 [Diospyros lotus]|uniref:probable sulfate transporter 3.4 isoform X2 n=1 Tax=Diospyros lotus TaxID=55363 RepID=UPI00225329A2|nr:probable sulfate transporter 3.4 isoform X2 [Diospyros lotus]
MGPSSSTTGANVSSPYISGDASTSSYSSPPVQIHPVSLPPPRTTFHKLKHRLFEIFFPDDPLHRFKNQTPLLKFLLAFQYIFPISQWLPCYSLQLFRSDFIAGLTIASLAIPQGISYAKLAHLPPIIGLYSSFVPPLIYTVLGSSRHLGVGPVSIASLVMGTMLSEMVSATHEPDLYLKLAFTSTFFAGVFQASLGIFRSGFIIDFLSKATLIGFMAGAAIIVSLQQLKGLLGIAHFTNKMQIVPVLSSVFHHKQEWSWQTILMGFSFLVFLLTARQIGSMKPKLFWVSAAAPLVSVILSTLLTFSLRSEVQDLSIIGTLPKGLNPSSLKFLYFHGPHLGLCIKTGVITGMLSLTEGIAVGRTFASLQNYQLDGNKEMTAIGLMNIAGSFSSCYVTTGSFSRSAVNHNAGAKTAFSNIVMAAAVLVTLLFLMPLFYYTPNFVLAAIIITAVIGLIDYKAAIRLWKIDKLDFLACLCSFFGVLFLSVQMGLAIAVGVSILKIILHITRPNTNVMGNIPGTQVYQSLSHYENVLRVPSFLILSIESPIYFANSTYLQERILRLVREEEERIQNNKETSLKCVILDMKAVTAIDSSGLDALYELNVTMDRRSLQLVLVNPVGGVMEKLKSSKLLDLWRLNGLYLTVGEAVADISSTWKL